MTTKQIDCCVELAHTLNFSRAAENMFVSQPTLTYQIRLLEEEVGFPIFERSGKGAALTPAGAQFVSFLAGMREELKRAVEQGQNFSATYRDSISIGLMVRQAVYFLPEAIRLFAETNSDVQITPVFRYENGVESFLRNEVDILFALKEQTKQIPGIAVHELFESRVYLIADKNDPLAGKNIIREEDLYGRTLMVGGGSPPALKAVQNRLIGGAYASPRVSSTTTAASLPGSPMTAKRAFPACCAPTKRTSGKACRRLSIFSRACIGKLWPSRCRGMMIPCYVLRIHRT